jgi:thymidylate kinase
MNKSDVAGSGPPPPAAKIGRSVALIGADGAGKSTVARAVVEGLPFDAGYLYMGVNLEASPVMLPTTRLALALKRRRGGRADMTVGHTEPGWRGGGPFTSARRIVRMVNWLAEEGYRAFLASRIRKRPATVIFDRHFFCDYYASAIAPGAGRRPIDARIHGYVLRRWYPRPELTLFLDAPPEVLVARKVGDTVERVSKRRFEYLELERVLPSFQVVDANRPTKEVVDDVISRIVAFVRGELDMGQIARDLPGPAGSERDEASEIRHAAASTRSAPAEPQQPPQVETDDSPETATAALSALLPTDNPSSAPL